VTPFVLISLLVLALVFVAPGVAVWLPNLIG
jgi:TRAP-type C4-dicarboxylate transport system permease large subunit